MPLLWVLNVLNYQSMLTIIDIIYAADTRETSFK